ncbi:MAG: DsbA family protein [Acidobacteria bacterium]|nr:DsbA family protein [Acidobacteriota bacterium]
MRHLLVFITVCVLAFGLAGSSRAAAQSSGEDSTLRQEMDGLKQQMKVIQDQLQQLLAARPPGPAPFQPIDIQVGGFPTLGSADSKVTIVEFTDFECPFCARHFKDVYPRLAADFIEKNKLRYVIRDFPLVTTHKAASKAAEVAHCAGDQGKYREMHEHFFRNQTTLQTQDFLAMIRTVGLNPELVQKCLEEGKYTQQVQDDIAEGRKAGVRGTPTFLLGVTEPGSSTLRATKILTGAVPYEQFEAMIETMSK